jgi:hypothetical protein
MKTYLIYPIILILTIIGTSCKKEFPNDPVGIKNLTVSGCKSREDLGKSFAPEYITLKTVDDYYLLFSHINSVFNCEPGQITVSVEILSNTVTINENESKAGLRCNCTYDITYKLGPLQYGTYTIVFQKGDITFKEYSLIFDKSTSVRIDL